MLVELFHVRVYHRFVVPIIVEACVSFVQVMRLISSQLSALYPAMTHLHIPPELPCNIVLYVPYPFDTAIIAIQDELQLDLQLVKIVAYADLTLDISVVDQAFTNLGTAHITHDANNKFLIFIPFPFFVKQKPSKDLTVGD